MCVCAQSCLTLCDPVNHGLAGSSVHGIFQARILEWVAISYSRDLPEQGIKPMIPLSLLHYKQIIYHCTSWEVFTFTAKSLQSCPTLCDPIGGSPPGSPIPGILQARTLEWVAISLSDAWKWKVKVKLLSRVRLLVTPWTAAYQAPPSMGSSRQEYWSGVPLPSPFTFNSHVKKTDLLDQLRPRETSFRFIDLKIFDQQGSWCAFRLIL